MSHERHHSMATLTRLRQEVAEDRAAMEARAMELDEARDKLDDRAWAAFAAVALHGWYTALEACLERIARTVDGEVPAGDRWHRELLSQMTVEVPHLRPAVLPRDLLPELYELLAFRHFFLHAYAVSLEAARLESLLQRARGVRAPIDAALDSFAAHLEAAVEALASE